MNTNLVIAQMMERMEGLEQRVGVLEAAQQEREAKRLRFMTACENLLNSIGTEDEESCQLS